MNLRHSAKWVALAALTLVAAGCPKAPPADPIEPGPVITSFTASQAQVARGTTVTLSWSTEHATQVKLEDLKAGPIDGATDPSGSVDVQVNSDSLFVLTATNNRGAAERMAVSVRVNSSAHDLMLYALPAQISAGESAILTWSTPDATTVSITATPGGAIDLKGQTTTGSVTVTPNATTTYTLDADGKTATTTVTVQPKILAFSSTPTSAKLGTTLTLSWQVAGATEVSLTSAGRGVLVTETDPAKVASGSFDDAIPAQVDPGAVYSYRLVAKDSSGVVTEQTLSVYVEGVPVVKTVTAPTYARAGQTFTLAWTAAEADSLTIAADGVVFYEAPSAAKVLAGSLAIPTPANKTTYTVTAVNSRGGTNSKTVDVDPVGAAAISTFTAAPTTVSGGDAVTLSWTTTSARSFRITEAQDGLVYAFDGKQDSGTFTVYPNHNAVYTLKVDNTFGETATQTASVTVNAPVALTASVTGTLIQGTPVDMSWTYGTGSNLIGAPHPFVDTRATSTGFDDISTTGNKVSLSAKTNVSALLPVSFPVTLFGVPVGQQIRVNTHGLLTFGATQQTSNNAPVDLPTNKLDPLTLAPFWASLTIGGEPDAGIYWQVKSSGNEQILIVQWNKMLNGSNTGIVFEAKVHSTGQVDFEYAHLVTTLTHRVGAQSASANWAVMAPSSPADGSGYTLFGARPSPINFNPVTPSTFSGVVATTNGFLRLSYTFGNIINPGDLTVTEVMAKPLAAIATTGEWFEVTNTTANPVDLTNWQVTISDGGTFPLQGNVPASGSLVFGQSTDPSLNGDAGVQIAVPGLDLNDTAESLMLTHVGALPAQSWASSPDAGTARAFDPNQYRNSSGSITTNTTCAATNVYSTSPGVQLGTPGQVSSCNFGYVMSSIPGAFFDIAATGTPVINDTLSYDGKTVPITLPTNAPAPIYFGVPRPIISMSNDGWAVFASTTTTNFTNKSYPNTSSPVGTMAPFWEDAYTNGSLTPKQEMYWQRVGSGVDPAAPAAHWVFQWSNMGQYYSRTDSFTYQVKMFDDGTIEYHYGQMISTSVDNYANGNGATVWLENPAGTLALAYSVNQPKITSNMGIRFTPR